MSLNWKEALTQADALGKDHQHAAARDLLRSALPENAEPAHWFRIARAEIACQDLDSAQEALDAARGLGLAAPLDLQLTVALGIRRRDYDAVMSAARAALDAGTEIVPPARLNIALAALETGQNQLAEEQADLVLSTHPEHPKAIEIKYQAATRFLPEDTAEAELAARMFAPGHGPAHLIALRELRAAMRRDPERLQRLVDQAMAHWADHPDLAHHRSKNLPPEFGAPPKPAGKGRLDLIQARLEQITAGRPHFAPLVPRIVKDIEEDMLTRDPVLTAVEDTITQSENTGSGHVVVYFHGLAEVALMTVAMDAYLNCAGANAIYLRDPDRLLFTAGHAELGGDLDSAAEALQARIDSFGPRHSLTMIGVSAGGFGAVLFGARLKADRVVCFSSPTVVDRAFADSIGDRRARSILHRIETLAPDRPRLLRPVLDAQDPPLQLDLIYGADQPQDSAYAEVVRGAPGVTLYPIKGLAEHASIIDIMQRGLFMDVLRGNLRRVAALGPQ
ncbi:tetratricopeptide repeat protein [Thalassococcus sp. BH17M4-6]|uniref:tetratricopeptide repeat protein n=1 Tax=Thalassococcus sp. BH17M4-6 TaxID=3413148 RepID=UPI003BBC1164